MPAGPRTVRAVPAVTFTFSGRAVPCHQDALSRCLNPLRWATEDDWRAEQAQDVLDSLTIGTDARALHRQLLDILRPMGRYAPLSRVLRSCTRNLRTHSGLWVDRNCECLRDASREFGTEVQAALPAEEATWARTTIRHPALARGATATLSDRSGSLSWTELYQAVTRWRREAISNDIIVAILTIDGRPGITVTAGGRGRPTTEILLRQLSAEEATLAWRGRSQCPEHPVHQSFGSSVMSLREGMVPLALLLTRDRDSGLYPTGCPYTWPDTWRECFAGLDDQGLAAATRLAGDWAGSTAQLAETAAAILTAVPVRDGRDLCPTGN